MKNTKLMPLDIQFFAENEGTNPVTQTEEKTEETVTDTVTKTEKAEERTFTQEEVNAMIMKAQKKLPSKDELKAFNDWKESQKTEAEKQTELTQRLTDTSNENTALKQENQILKSGVNANDVDYVLFKVSKMEGEFEDNLKDFLKDNPKYLQKEETPKSTGLPQNKTSLPKSEEQAYLDKKYAKNPYYKQK